MLVSIDNFINTPILSLQTGVEIARTKDVIIDPRLFKIVALWVTGPLLQNIPTVLHPEDIREISDIGFIVDDNESLMTTEGLVRLQQVIDFGFTLPGILVKEETGRKLGRVKEYAIDPESFYVQQIYVKPSIVKSFTLTELSIRRSQIISVTNSEIIVKSATVKKAAPVKAVEAPEFVNPFRSTAPTEAIEN